MSKPHPRALVLHKDELPLVDFRKGEDIALRHAMDLLTTRQNNYGPFLNLQWELHCFLAQQLGWLQDPRMIYIQQFSLGWIDYLKALGKHFHLL